MAIPTTTQMEYELAYRVAVLQRVRREREELLARIRAKREGHPVEDRHVDVPPSGFQSDHSDAR